MSNKIIILITILFVAFVAIANLIRFFWNISVSIGLITLPGWTGAIFYIAFGLLTTFALKALNDLYLTPPTTSLDP